ncbi:hypothetical protein CVT24_012768, partial [Panaeolus cyanescens]
PPPPPTTSDPTTPARPPPTNTGRPPPTSASNSSPTSNTRTSSPTSLATTSDDQTRTLPGQLTITHTVTGPSTPPPDPGSQTLDDDAVSDPQGEKKKSTPIGAIVGGVGGGILFIAILCALYFFCVVRRRRKRDQGTMDIVPPTAVSPFFDNPPYGDYSRTGAISPPMSHQMTGTGVSFVSHSNSSPYNPFADGSERMTERTVSPSGVSAQYAGSVVTDPPIQVGAYQDHRSIAKSHHPTPSFTTTLSNTNSNSNSNGHSNSTFSPPSSLPNTEPHRLPPHMTAVSSNPFQPLRRGHNDAGESSSQLAVRNSYDVGVENDDDMQSMRTSTRLSRGGILPPPYDPDTAPPMPLRPEKS